MNEKEQYWKNNYVVERWEDVEQTQALVRCLKPGKSSMSPDTVVDLNALAQGDYFNACQKRCYVQEAGLCLHILCALKSKERNFWHYLKEEDTIKGVERCSVRSFTQRKAWTM